MPQAHCRRLERMYASAPINDFFRPRPLVSDGTAELRMVVRRDFFHAAQAVHGSVYFKAMGDAGFFAVNSLVEDVFVLTANFNLHLTRPMLEGEMLAVARVVHRAHAIPGGSRIVRSRRQAGRERQRQFHAQRDCADGRRRLSLAAVAGHSRLACGAQPLARKAATAPSASNPSSTNSQFGFFRSFCRIGARRSSTGARLSSDFSRIWCTSAPGGSA